MKKNNLFHTMREVAAFALPMSASGVINMLTSFISMMMVAFLGKEQLAAGALAIPTFLTITTVTATIFYAVGILISHRKSQNKNPAEIGLIVRNGFWLAIFLAFPAALGLWYADKLLLFLGQNPALVADARSYFHFAAFSMFPMLINSVIAQFYAGTGKPHYILWVAFINLLITVLVAYGLILGHFGLPLLGLSGITGAFLVAQSLILVNVLLLLYWQEKFQGVDAYRIFIKISLPNWSIYKAIFVLGMPIGIQFGGELAAMTAATYLMGRFGTTALAASQIVNQYSMLIVVLIMGLTQALSLLVSQAYGREDYVLIKKYLQAAVAILILCCIFVGIIFFNFPKMLIQFYMSNKIIDSQLEYLSVVFFAISACLLLVDGVRHLLSGALRGLHDSRGPMKIGLISLWLVSLPISYLVGIAFHGGPIGLRLGFVSGFIFAAIILFMRVRNKIIYNDNSRGII